MNNYQWLLQMDGAERKAWFDAEHVETEERALDGGTEPENADSRELILADLEKKTREWHDYDGNFMRIYSDVAYAQMKELLDRQAAITEEQTRCKWVTASADEIAAWRSKAEKLQAEVYELTTERDKLQEQLRISWESECRLQAERDKFKEANDYHAAQYELASEDCDRLQAKLDKLKAERVKLRSQICKLEDDLVRANDENKHVSFADRIRFVDRIDELTAERDNLKANNEQLHMLAGEQAAKIDELQSAFDAICANLSIIVTGEPSVIADIAIETIDALIDECNTANRQCNEYRSKFGKCLDYADAIHALMDDEGMA